MNCLVYRLEYKGYYYVGSTNNLYTRLKSHKSVCFNTILIDGLYNYEQKIVEDIFIDLSDDFCINSQNENQTKENRLNQMKQYNQNNKEEIKEYKKQHYQNNKERLKEYQQKNRDRKKLEQVN